MSTESAKPVIFISYSHKDEPERPREGEIQWLSFVRTYLQPAVKHGVFDLWVDRHMPGGTDWDPEIERRLRDCDIFILLVSANSMASDYIIDKEIAIIRERQANGEPVHFYPLLLTPTPKAGLDKVKDKNLRPRDAKPFSSYSVHDRAQHMTDAADEIAELVEQIAKRKSTERPSAPRVQPAYVHITGLPETAYERLVGREAELKRLDEAWPDAKTNILSLVAEGGAGKSALVNEWLKRLQANNYRGAEAVLGWSFYSQGTKERATSADAFLNWALEKLGITLAATNASAKGEAIAEAMMQRRVLLLLDGVEPLQHGLDTQLGQLRDQGLRALLRRFAAMPPGAAHGLVVLTSRLPVKDIARWQDGAAPVLDVERLSDEAGAALLRDNGVWGTDGELKAAARDFGGHPLALALLASFLKETQTGDARRRDHIRAFFADPDNPLYDHAKRVMESLEKEWLAGQPMLLGIMHIVGLFDRPASGDCLRVLREDPPISGLPTSIVVADDEEWNRAITRLREARLLAPTDFAAPDALDTHPLVRDWFGERFRQAYPRGWRVAHGRIYEYLRNTTIEGSKPRLEDLAPLYQAIIHGCRAGRQVEVLDEIYRDRICRRRPDPNRSLEYYAMDRLGAVGSELAAISWFFDKPYVTVTAKLSKADQITVERLATNCLRAQGRFTEALPVHYEQVNRLRYDSPPAGIISTRRLAQSLNNLALSELLVGHIANASDIAANSIGLTKPFADHAKLGNVIAASLALQANVLNAAGQRNAAEHIHVEREQFLKRRRPKHSLYTTYAFCELLLDMADYPGARNRANEALSHATSLLNGGLYTLVLGCAHLGLTLKNIASQEPPIYSRDDARASRARLDHAVEGLRASGVLAFIPRGLLARATFRRNVGDWDGTAHDLDEVEEVAEPGPTRLFLCDMAMERARLALARSEAFAPLHGLIDGTPPKPEQPGEVERKTWRDEAAKQIALAADYIEKCGYHRRNEELAELQAVLKGEKIFAELPPRV